MDDTTERLIRLEEGMVRVHGDILGMREDIKARVMPMAEKVDQHHVDVAILKRDRFWVAGIVSAFISGLTHVLTKKP